MKKTWLLAFLIFLASFVSAQQTFTYTPMTAAGYQFKYLKADSGFNLPNRDTTTGRGTVRGGSMVFDSVARVFYGWDGVKWNVLGSGGGGGGSVDSITVSGNNICQWIGGVPNCYVITGGGTFVGVDSLTYSGNSICWWKQGVPTCYSLTPGVDSVTVLGSNFCQWKGGVATCYTITGDVLGTFLDSVVVSGGQLCQWKAGVSTCYTINSTSTLQMAFDADPTASPQISAHGNPFIIDSTIFFGALSKDGFSHGQINTTPLTSGFNNYNDTTTLSVNTYVDSAARVTLQAARVALGNSMSQHYVQVTPDHISLGSKIGAVQHPTKVIIENPDTLSSPPTFIAGFDANNTLKKVAYPTGAGVTRDSLYASNDSVYFCRAGVCSFAFFVRDTVWTIKPLYAPSIDSIGILASTFDSLLHKFIDTGARIRQGYVLSYDSANHKWVMAAPATGGGGGTVTNVTGTSPIQVATGTTTPVISITTADATHIGALSSTDWNTFNTAYNTITAPNDTTLSFTRINGGTSSVTIRGGGTILNGTGYVKQSGTTPSYLTPTQVTADLNLFSSTLKGLTPLSGGGTTNFLRADGTWAAPSVPAQFNPIAGSNITLTGTYPNITFAASNGGGGTLTGGGIAWPGTIYNTPTTGTVSGGTITFSPTLASQAANTLFGNNTGSSAAPVFFTNPYISALRRNAGNTAVEANINGSWSTQYQDSTGGRAGWNLTGGNTGTNFPDTSVKIGTNNLTSFRIMTNNTTKVIVDSGQALMTVRSPAAGGFLDSNAIYLNAGIGAANPYIELFKKGGTLGYMSMSGANINFGTTATTSDKTIIAGGIGTTSASSFNNQFKVSSGDQNFVIGASANVFQEFQHTGSTDVGGWGSASGSTDIMGRINGATSVSTGTQFIRFFGATQNVMVGSSTTDINSSLFTVNAQQSALNTFKASIPAPRMTLGQRDSITSGLVGVATTGWTIAGGTGYTPGTYANAVLTGGTGAGAHGNITVSAGGVVTGVTLTDAGGYYVVGDVLSASGLGAGSGFTITLVSLTSTVAGAKVFNTTSNSDNTYNGTNWAGDFVVSGAGTLTLKHGVDYVFTGSTATYTLPAISSTLLGRGNMIKIKNRGSGTITLNANSGSTIYSTSAVSTINIVAGAAAELMPDGTYFLVMDNN